VIADTLIFPNHQVCSPFIAIPVCTSTFHIRPLANCRYWDTTFLYACKSPIPCLSTS